MNRFLLLLMIGVFAAGITSCGNFRVVGDVRRAYTTNYNLPITRIAPNNDPNLKYKGGKEPVNICEGVPSKNGFHCQR